MIRNNNFYFFVIIALFFCGVFSVYTGAVFAQGGTVNASVKIAACGNGVIEAGELCDGSDLNGATCQSLGFKAGTLRCANNCVFDTSQCFDLAPSGGRLNANTKAVTQNTIMGDLNGDGKVDLLDFSIAAYWYGKTITGPMIQIEKNALNGDGKIDLIDFSIIAFNWTG